MNEKETTQTKPRRKLRIRRLAATAFIAAGVAVATLGLGAAPALAATPQTTATVCFRHNTGQAYQYNVYAMFYADNVWTIAWNYPQKSTNGCTTWPVSTGYHWAFRAYLKNPTSYYHGTYYMGTSATYFIKAGYTYNYGTAYVYPTNY